VRADLPPELLPWTPLLATLGLLLAVQLLARGALRSLVAAGGWSAVPWLTGWLGVPVHELSHAAVCVVLRRPVTELRLFAPDASSGTLGYVKWQPGTGPVAWLSPLLVGLAPLAGSALALHGLLWLAGTWAHAPSPPMPEAPPMALWTTAVQQSADHAIAITTALWKRGGWHRGAAVGFWYVSAAVAAHGVPSREDLAGAWKGLLLLSVLGALGWGAAKLAEVPVSQRLPTLGAQAASAVVPALALGAVALLGLWLLSVLARRLRS
jgi:hypothetical protein